jgi:hypothetical protein
MVILHVAMFLNVRNLIGKGYSDFAIYYCAGAILREGMGGHLYDNVTQFRVQQEFAPDVPIRQGALPYTHPPFEGLFFAPLTYLSYQQAFVLWDSLNLVMLVAVAFLLRPYLPHMGGKAALICILAALAFFPVLFAFIQGQDAILLLLLYALTFVSLKRNRHLLAGVCLALGLFKFHLILPFVILLLAMKSFRFLYGFVPVGAVLAGASVALVGPGQLLSYPRYVLQVENTMAAGAIVPADNVTLRGILFVLLPAGDYLVPVILAASVALLGVAVWKLQKAGMSFESKFAFAVVTTILVGYHAMGYDLTMLLLPIFLITDRLMANETYGRDQLLAKVAIALLFFSPAYMVLLMRYNHLAFMGLPVLLLFAVLAVHRTTAEMQIEPASVA